MTPSRNGMHLTPSRNGMHLPWLLLVNVTLFLCTMYVLTFTTKSKFFLKVETSKVENYFHNLDPTILNSAEKIQRKGIITSHNSGQVKFSNVAVNTLYKVPDIEYTQLADCEKLFDGDEDEVSEALSTMSSRPKVPLKEEVYLDWTQDCDRYKTDRGFITEPLTQEEAEYPLAFSIAMYTDIEQTERLLRMIYQPQNIYCVHIDVKAPLLLHRTVRSIANCFPNVFIASHLDKIKWGDVSVLLPALNCMKDLMHFHRGRWKYYINLTGQEMPLRTNYELVKIAKIFNGSNDIAGSIPRMQKDSDRVLYKWSHRWSKTYQQTILYRTNEPKAPPPYNLTFYKGELHGFFTHGMVEYIVESEVGRSYFEWCWDSGHPSEHYWNVLNYNRHLKAPGSYYGPQKLADEYSYHPVVRAKNWMGFYNSRECHGKFVRGICVYGVGDLPWLVKRLELAANKFHLSYQYLAYDCLERRHRMRTKLKDKVYINTTYYKNVPTVLYARKDGLS